MRRIITLAFCCVTVSASAQEPEHVLVEKERGLAGLWQIAVPEYVSVNIFHNAKFGPMRFIFCRIEEELEIHCVNGGFSRNGSVSADGNTVHIAWGTAMARLAIDGVRAGDAITGTFTFKLSGIAHDDPALSISTRFSRPVPDAGGKTAYLSAVLGQLAENNLTLPHDGPAIAKNGGALPTNFQSFGTIQQISFLGKSPKIGGADADFFSVYAVEFERAERICGLHQRGDETLDAFRCV